MAGYGPPRTVRTPWGQMEDLREQRLAPSSGIPRERIARNQRERLFGAMVASVTTNGYRATAVADLLELSGVSRSAFYGQFHDKESCFLATFDAVVAKAMKLLSDELDRNNPEAGARKALRRLLEMVAEEPAAARLCFNDAYAAGKAGHTAVENAMNGFAEVVEKTISKVNGKGELPQEMVHGLLGGAQAIIQGHLSRGEEAALPDMTPDLWDWALGYEVPPAPLRLAGRRPRLAEPHAPPLAAYDQAERIIRALANAAAEHGYPSVKIAEIAARASVSQATFYSHFTSKDAALVAALDLAGAQTLAAMLPAGRRAADWPHGVRGAIGALCAFGATEPDLVWLTAIEAYASGRMALDQRDRMIGAMRDTFSPGFRLAPDTKPIVADAVIGVVAALLHKQLVDRGPQSLPEVAPLATYMVLAPFLGAEQAADIANGDGRGGR